MTQLSPQEGAARFNEFLAMLTKDSNTEFLQPWESPVFNLEDYAGKGPIEIYSGSPNTGVGIQVLQADATVELRANTKTGPKFDPNREISWVHRPIEKLWLDVPTGTTGSLEFRVHLDDRLSLVLNPQLRNQITGMIDADGDRINPATQETLAAMLAQDAALIGEVGPAPTANTVLDRLLSVSTRLAPTDMVRHAVNLNAVAETSLGVCLGFFITRINDSGATFTVKVTPENGSEQTIQSDELSAGDYRAIDASALKVDVTVASGTGGDEIVIERYFT